MAQSMFATDTQLKGTDINHPVAAVAQHNTSYSINMLNA